MSQVYVPGQRPLTVELVCPPLHAYVYGAVPPETVAVAVPLQAGKHRLLHIHKNVPGVLMNINRVFAENNINIAAQSLMTNEAIGYLVMDVDAEYSAVALEKLQHVDGTIRARVLY